jgi:hypothetical protein
VIFINKKKTFTYIFLLSIVILSFSKSLYFAIHNTEPLHSNLVFFDSYKKLQGESFYKDILIIYGPLATLFNALCLSLFGKFVLSLSLGTAIIYSSSFIIYYFILANLSFSKKNSLIIILLIFTIHPGIVLPWANYLSYFFLLLAFLLFSLPSNKNLSFFLFGILLGLAALSRQTIFLPIFLFLLSTFFFNKLKTKRLYTLFGLSVVILVFFLYLLFNNLVELWFLQSFKIWTIYTYKDFHPSISETLGYLNYLILIKDLLSKLLFSFVNLDFKWIFYFLLMTFNIFFLISSFFYKKDYQKEYKLVMISIISIFFFSEAIHINEIFRLSTGAIIGLIPLYFYLSYLSKKFINNLNYRNFFFLYCFYPLLLFFFMTFFYTLNKSYQNYKFILNINKVLSEPKISFLKFQRFPIEVSNFYEKFNFEIKKIHSLYKIDYNYNFSDNALLPIISDTKSFRISSFYNYKGFAYPDYFLNFYNYYPALRFSEISKNKFNNVMIFVLVKDKYELNRHKKNFNFDHFFIFSEMNYPFHDKNKILLILLPNNVNQLKY